MKIKKYIAVNVAEGKAKIINDLGEDAIVLSSRILKDPSTGKDYYEFVAALDEGNQKKLPQSSTTLQTRKILESFQTKPSNTDTNNERNINGSPEIKEMLEKILNYVQYKNAGSLSPLSTRLYQSLIDSDISDDYATEIVGKVNQSGAMNDFAEMVYEARKILTSNIKIQKPLEKKPGGQVAAFIGITGSGKTTTLVKLAVITKLLSNADILILSADTYKVGGIEQLQTFATIAGIPFRTAYSNKDLSDIISQEKNRDFILIDTTGRSHKSKEFTDYLKETLDITKPDKTYLVQSATIQRGVFKRVCKALLPLKPDALILTKLDEAETVGGILDVIKDSGLPIAYFANGQRIPEDFEPAEKSPLGKIVLPDSLLK